MLAQQTGTRRMSDKREFEPNKDVRCVIEQEN